MPPCLLATALFSGIAGRVLARPSCIVAQGPTVCADQRKRTLVPTDLEGAASSSTSSRNSKHPGRSIDRHSSVSRITLRCDLLPTMTTASYSTYVEFTATHRRHPRQQLVRKYGRRSQRTSTLQRHWIRMKRREGSLIKATSEANLARRRPHKASLPLVRMPRLPLRSLSGQSIPTRSVADHSHAVTLALGVCCCHLLLNPRHWRQHRHDAR